MPTHRGFMENLRQPNDLLQHHASRLLTSSHTQIAVRWLVPACTLVAVLVGCGTLKPTVAAKPGIAFLLPVGGSAAIKGTETRIAFDRVRYDMRCPADEVCDNPEHPLGPRRTPTDASVLVVISRKGLPSESRILNLTPPTNETILGDLRIRLEDLTPEPRRSNFFTPDHYLAQMIVNRT